MTLGGVIFDFDGVIADTEALHLRAYQQTLAGTTFRLGRDAYYERYLGYDDVGVFTALARDHGRSLPADELRRLVSDKGRRFDSLLAAEPVIFPGAAECIQRLASMTTLGIASGALHHEIERILQGAGLRQHFDSIVGADDVDRPKPAPDAYREAVQRVTGRRAAPDWGSFVAVEDSHWGLESARAAGLTCIGITNSYPATALAAADVIIETLSELDGPLLDRLCRERSHRPQS